ncbi:hypothetical protein [Spongiactinospora sp. TRM90649]|uniref:hypothetical protein n=1 Tax=Spongiactinospora sp. TRM90649 TaxID=3031114 RepID=UPI0023F93578|nr:hypothetical protein [Spongiactinospora sp. TRM90649]MDF5756534.1 hypothetical protein [Spongiactinospora sp. TRM90649]
MAEPNCADHLADGPLSTADLAGRCGADAGAPRILRDVRGRSRRTGGCWSWR